MKREWIYRAAAVPVLLVCAVHAHGGGGEPRAVHSLAASVQTPIAGIATGRFENQSVTLTGTVRQYAIEKGSAGHRAVLKLAVGYGGQSVDVLVSQFEDLDLTRIVDSTVEVRGIAGSYRNHRGQFLAAVVTSAGKGDVRVIEPGLADPFDIPFQSIGELLTSKDHRRGDHRVKIRGVFTCCIPGRELFLQSGNDAILVKIPATATVRQGEVVDVVGFEAPGDASPHLTHGIVRPAAAEGTLPPKAVPANFFKVVGDELDARVIQFDGLVFDVVHRSTEVLIVLQDGNNMIGAYLYGAHSEKELGVQPGAKVRLTGVASLIFNESHKPISFSLHLPDRGGIRVLQPAPWWNVRRALTFLASAGSVILLVFIWVVSLRKRVSAQTQLIRATLKSTADAILIINDKNRAVGANSKFRTLWGCHPADHHLDPNVPVMEWLGPHLVEDRSLGILLSGRGSSEPGNPASTVLTLRNGLAIECDYERIKGGLTAGAVLSFRDITARLRSQRLERDRNRILEAISREDPLEDVLPQICRFAESQDDRIRTTIRILENDPAKPGQGSDRALRGLANTVFRNGVEDDTKYRGEVVAALTLLSSDNAEIGNLLVSAAPLVPINEDLKSVITNAAQLAGIAIEHKRLFERLGYLAYHDSLTGRLNRGALEEALSRTIEAARSAGTTFGLLCIDLDRFKQINDTLSHRIGDLFICAVAERLSETAIENGATIFRVGGDEFTVLLKPGSTLVQAEQFAEIALARLREPFRVGERDLHTTGSMGISLFPADGGTPAALQQAADSAMYRAKEAGKDGYKAFRGEWRVQEEGSFEMEALLRKAVEFSWFEMHYQPKVDNLRRVCGLEALIRLRHPETGLISPDKFISVAEDCGLIVQIGAWALDEVCRQICVWRSSGMDVPRIAVNVSAAQFARGGFLTTVRQVLERWQLAGEALELELTESLLMKNIGEASHLMRELTQLGITFAIDDFGTGYSSLSYLHTLPVSTMKVDRSFVSALDGTENTTPLVTTMVQLARNLQLEVVAEGVETEYQFRLLQTLGCDYFQGYLFCRPLPAPKIESLLRQSEIRVPSRSAETHAKWPVEAGTFETGLVH